MFFFWGEGGIDCELNADLKNLRDSLLSRFYIYIMLKIKIKKRCITVIPNTSTGIDSEFEFYKFKRFKNKLLSVQTAVHRITLVKVPGSTIQ